MITCSFQPTTQSFLDKMTKEQDKRQQTLRAACERYNISREWLPYKVEEYTLHFLVDDKYKILFNYIPKVSCTTWKTVLASLRASHDQQSFARLRDYPYKEILYKLENYRKVLFVREPITRVLSAFLSKFHPPDNPRLQAIWEAVYGKEMVLLYRKGWKAKPVTFHLKLKDVMDKTNFAGYAYLNITFDEFIQYITELEHRRGRIVMDETNDHWLPMHRVSNACLIKYDFIGHYENLAVEAPYVLRWLGVDHVIQFPDVHTSRASQSLIDEYHKIPLDLLRRLWKYYQVDYDMFGYSFNETLNSLMTGLFV